MKWMPRGRPVKPVKVMHDRRTRRRRTRGQDKRRAIREEER